MNKTIVKLIKAARIERGLTQKDLADHLGKTSAAISDLERGKVQISANDLYKISQLLNKPIEYFYGEDTGDKEIEDLIVLLRRQNPKNKSNTILFANMLLKMRSLYDEVLKYPDGSETALEKMLEFYGLFVPFSDTINEMVNEINGARFLFDKGVKIKGLDNPSISKHKK
jgi:transcriptional regulator with XRE-family HTH domain